MGKAIYGGSSGTGRLWQAPVGAIKGVIEPDDKGCGNVAANRKRHSSTNSPDHRLGRILEPDAVLAQDAIGKHQVIAIRLCDEVECVDVPGLKVHAMHIIAPCAEHDSANLRRD